MNVLSYTTCSLIVAVAACSAAAASGQAVATQDATVTTAAGTLEEIVVTAQRREERNQRVPIAITAFSNERLQQQNIRTGQDLNGLVPSLQVSANGQSSRDVETFTLRGIGQTVYGAPSVPIYLSEVPIIQGYSISQQGGPGNLIDLENLQVLAGPQGTLFGRNTTGGAALLVPRRPTNDFSGYVEASGGNYDYNGFEGVINVPIISDKLLVRVAATYQNRDGYTHDIVWNKNLDNMNYFSGRIGVLFRPTDRIENYLLAFGTYSDNNGTSYINNGTVVSSLVAQGLCTAPCTVYQSQSNLAQQLGPRATRIDVDQFDRLKTGGIINKTSIDLTDELTVNNIVSFQRFWRNWSLDADGTPLQTSDYGGPYPTFPVPGLSDKFGIAPNGYFNTVEFGPKDDLQQITEELQLQGKMLDNHLTFTVGAFYFSQDPSGPQLNRPVFSCPPAATGSLACTPFIQTYSVSSESEALYAQGTLDLGVFSPSLENLRVTGGFRYSWDATDGTSNFFVPFPGGGYCISAAQVVFDTTQCAYSAQLRSEAPTWTFGVDYALTSDFLAYAKVSRGYKAGGFNPFAVRVETRTFKPEYVTSYETGFKSDWRVGSVPVRLNLTGFSSDYSDIQLVESDVASNGASGAKYTQGSAQIDGVEFEGSMRPIRPLEIGANVSYTDARKTDCGASCTPFPAPKWIFSVHGSLDLPVPESWGAVNLYANYAYVSKVVTSLTEPGGVLEPYGLLNLSARWTGIARSNVDLELFATNVTDKLYRNTNSNVSGSGFFASIYGEPQMYGFRLRYRFGE